MTDCRRLLLLDSLRGQHAYQLLWAQRTGDHTHRLAELGYPAWSAEGSLGSQNALQGQAAG